MAKVTKKSSYDLIVKALETELKSVQKTKKGADKKTLSQEEVFKFLDKKKLLVSEEGADELFDLLESKKIISLEADENDLDEVGAGLGGEIELQSFDDTMEISLDDVNSKVELKDVELENKLTSTDDIVK